MARRTGDDAEVLTLLPVVLSLTFWSGKEGRKGLGKGKRRGREKGGKKEIGWKREKKKGKSK